MSDAVGLILSLVSLFGVVAAIGRWVLKVLRATERIEDQIIDVAKAAYTAVIMNENVPLSERVCAGEKYIAIGGNGKIKEAVIVLSKKMNDELSARLEMENYNKEV